MGTFGPLQSSTPSIWSFYFIFLLRRLVLKLPRQWPSVQTLSEYQSKLETLEAEAAKLLQEYRELGERERDRIREEAKTEAARIKRDATQLAARELESARLSIEKDLVLSAFDKAEAEIQLKLTRDDKQRLVASYFGELETAVQREVVPQSGQEAS